MIRISEAADPGLLGDWECIDTKGLTKALNAQWQEGWEASLQLYYLSCPAALVEDFPKFFRRVGE